MADGSGSDCHQNGGVGREDWIGIKEEGVW